MTTYEVSLNSSLVSTYIPLVDSDVRIDCVEINSNIVFYFITTLHYLVCLIGIMIGLVAIFKFYLRSSMLKVLKICSIICTLSWIVSGIAWIVNWHATYDCDSYDLFISTQVICGLSMGIGYCLLYVCYVIRVIKSFEDSVFEISVCQKRIFHILGFIFAFLTSITGLLFVFHIFEVGFVMFPITLLFYILVSIMLVKIILSKTFQFFILVTSASTDVQKVSKQSNSETEPYNSAVFEIMVRLTVVYSAGLFSTILLCIALIIVSIFTQNDDAVAVNGMVMIMRLIYMSEQIVNCCCLLFQNKIAKKLYDKQCRICHQFVRQCYVKYGNR